jgi:hypothetical protein
LQLFKETITENLNKLIMAKIQARFTEAFLKAEKNIEFFIGQISNNFASDDKPWQQNRMHELDKRIAEILEGY